MKLNDNNQKAVLSLFEQLTQESDGRYRKVKPEHPRRKKGEKSPYRIQVERSARISAAYAAWRVETGRIGTAEDWNHSVPSHAYKQAWEGTE